MEEKIYLTTEELKSLLGITGKSIIPQWEADGMPYREERRGRRGGKPSHLFDKRQVLIWLENNASDGISTRARMELRKMDRGNAVSADDTADIPPPAGDGEAETEGEVEIDEKSKGLEGALLRTEKMELRLYELEKAAVDNGDVRRAALLEKHRLAAAKGIAELREQVRVQMEKEGRLADADALESEYLKSITMAKTISWAFRPPPFRP